MWVVVRYAGTGNCGCKVMRIAEYYQNCRRPVSVTTGYRLAALHNTGSKCLGVTVASF